MPLGTLLVRRTNSNQAEKARCRVLAGGIRQIEKFGGYPLVKRCQDMPLARFDTVNSCQAALWVIWRIPPIRASSKGRKMEFLRGLLSSWRHLAHQMQAIAI